MISSTKPSRSREGAAPYLYAAVLCLAGASVSLLTIAYVGSTSLDPRYLFGLSVAIVVGRLLTIQLPQGDRIRITLMVGVVGLLLRGVSEVVVGIAVASAIDVIYRYAQGDRTSVRQAVVDGIRSVSVLALMSSVKLYLPLATELTSRGEVMLVAFVGVGMIYALVDVFTLAVQQRILGGARVSEGLVLLIRPLGSVYLVHIAMAAVAARVYPSLGVWGIAIALLLTLILQNSFSLYLRIRRAYAQTIGALAHAAELDRPEDTGHSRRVADLSVTVGRRMGLSSEELDQVGYAALLHDIGRIGYEQPETDVKCSDRGADMVSGIPFLDGVAPLIQHHTSLGGRGVPRGAMIVGVCCRYDRLRKSNGARKATEMLAAEEHGYRRTVVDAIEHVAANDRGRLTTSKSLS